MERSADFWRGVLWFSNHCTSPDLFAKYQSLLAEAEAREAGPNKGHKWEIKPSVLPYPVCRVCGVVQRKDDQNSPCKGPTAIGLHEAQQPSAAEVIAAAERAIHTLTPSHRSPGCYCQHWIDVEKFGHCDKCKEAVFALAMIAKYKEAQR